MRPETRIVNIDGKQETVLNPSAVIELARSANTPQARALLAAYHEAECQIARANPFLSEDKIRSDAVMAAFKKIGMSMVDVSGKL